MDEEETGGKGDRGTGGQGDWETDAICLVLK